MKHCGRPFQAKASYVVRFAGLPKQHLWIYASNHFFHMLYRQSGAAKPSDSFFTADVRIHVFPHGSNPAIDPPLRKVSAYRAEQEVLANRAERLAGGCIRMLPPRGSKDGITTIAGLNDWRVVTGLAFDCLRIGTTTMQLRAR